MRAILLANATATSLGAFRLNSCVSHAARAPPPRPLRTCLTAEVAPTTSTLRKVSSPARVMTPSLTLPAVE
jgi:hypothetical protein